MLIFFCLIQLLFQVYEFFPESIIFMLQVGGHTICSFAKCCKYIPSLISCSLLSHMPMLHYAWWGHESSKWNDLCYFFFVDTRESTPTLQLLPPGNDWFTTSSTPSKPFIATTSIDSVYIDVPIKSNFFKMCQK